jgi:hypothetical protein
MGARAAAKKPLRGGVTEFTVTSFDGETLKGRVLLGATVEPLVIDGRLVEGIDVELKDIRACGTKDVLEHYLFDVDLPPIRSDQIITIRPGYWYGANVSYVLFSKQRSKVLPECFEAELVVGSLDGRDAAKLPIRVVRTDKPPALLDGGTEEPKPPASDAGAP